MKREGFGETQLQIAEALALVLPNELLFCIFCSICYWKQPVSVRKLARELRADDDLLRDHLNILIKCGLLSKQGEKYVLTDLGNEAYRFANEAMRQAKLTCFDSWAPVGDLRSETIVGVSSAVPSSSTVLVQIGAKAKSFGGAETEKAEVPAEGAPLLSDDSLTANAA